MATTIQVSDATKQLLELLKKKEKTPSYDQIIQILAKERAKVPSSMFGAIKGLKWKKKDRMDMHEL